MKRLDLSGRKIGQLKILGYSHSYVQPSGQKRAMWDVVCDCGNKKKMSTGTLLHQKTISCGCQGKINRAESRKKEFGYSNENYLYLQYKSRSIKKFGEFNITKEQFRELIYSNCFYCGKHPEQQTVKRCVNGINKSNGIDRVDNEIGYIYENCVCCCKVCNTMKMNLSVYEFLNHISKIFKYNNNVTN